MLTAIPAILAAILPILNRIIPDADKRIEVQAQLQEALIASQSAIYTSMSQVMAADAASESWMTRNLRPVAGFFGIGTIALILLSAPFGESKIFLDALKDIPSNLWDLVMVMTGGYILMRGAEKTAAAYAGGKK